METHDKMPEQDAPPPFWEDEKATGTMVDLLHLVLACLRGWPFLVLMGGAGLALGLAVAFSLTPLYTSKVVFLPPQQRFSALENPLASFFKAPSSEIYSGLLTSDSVLGDVVRHNDLQAKYRSKTLADARQALHRQTTVSAETSGFVTLQVRADNPTLARDLANGFLEALGRINDRLAVNDAARHRAFFRDDLEHEKNDLESAELALARAQEQSGVVLPQSQTQAGLTAIESIRASIRALEVRLAALRKSQTDQAPEVVDVRSQLGALESQLQGMQRGAGLAGGALSVAKAPQLNLEFVRLEREVRYHQALFDAASKQYESARLEESSMAPGVQVVDFPETPNVKSWPPRLLYGVGGGVLGFFLGLLILLVSAQGRHLLQDPSRRAFARQIAAALRHGAIRP